MNQLYMVKNGMNRLLIKADQFLKTDNSKYFLDYENPKFNGSRDITFKSVEKIPIKCISEYKWNAAIYCNKYVYGIPSGAAWVLKLNTITKEYTALGHLGNENKKWTGGGIWGHYIYGFPRVSNKLLCINTDNDEVKTVDIGCTYRREHHYGGVIRKGKIYQPPRDSNHVLVIDLKTYESRKVFLTNLPLRFRYCGSFLHPNGMIYFLPEMNERVMEYNPENDKFVYLGVPINAMTFSVGLAENGNLYGFSSSQKGILCVDIRNRYVGMIHEEIGCPGCYKNILYDNGRIYGLPGNGSCLWEYDILRDEVIKLYTESCDINKTKIASGCIAENMMIGLPAKSDDCYVIKFSGGG